MSPIAEFGLATAEMPNGKAKSRHFHAGFRFFRFLQLLLWCPGEDSNLHAAKR
jgi:hypothetical protein